MLIKKNKKNVHERIKQELNIGKENLFTPKINKRSKDREFENDPMLGLPVETRLLAWKQINDKKIEKKKRESQA